MFKSNVPSDAHASYPQPAQPQYNWQPANADEKNQQPYTAVPMPPGGYPPNGQPVYVVQQNQNSCDMPVGLILFLCGFVCSVAWWVGACCYPGKAQMNEREKTWRRVNIGMTVLSVLIIIAIIVIYAVFLSAVITSAPRASSNTRPRN